MGFVLLCVRVSNTFFFPAIHAEVHDWANAAGVVTGNLRKK